MCTRPAFGLFIGYFNICVYSVVLGITCLCLLGDINTFAREEANRQPTLDVTKYKSALFAYFIFFLVTCILMIVVSSLLVAGILKRRHKFMVPWLLLSIIGIGCTFSYNGVLLYIFKESALKLSYGMITMALQGLVIFPIFSLYQDVRTTRWEELNARYG